MAADLLGWAFGPLCIFAIVIEVVFQSHTLPSLVTSVLATAAPELADVSDFAAGVRNFVWCFFIFVLVWRLCLFTASKTASFLTSKFSALFVKLFVQDVDAPASKRSRRSTVCLIAGRFCTPGGGWDIDQQLLEVLMDEAAGLSSIVWYSVLALLAAMYTGIASMATCEWLKAVVVVLVTWRSVSLGSQGIEIVGHSFVTSVSLSTDDASVRRIIKAMKLMITAFGVLFVMSRMGYNVSGTLTGMGFVSVVLTLSAQATLTDFLSWLVIVTNKPFSTDDFISVGDRTPGVVERIGFLMTQVRPLAGELETYSNRQLLASTIANHSTITRRRQTLGFEVSACLSSDAVAKIPDLARAAVEATVRFEYSWIEHGEKHVWKKFEEARQRPDTHQNVSVKTAAGRELAQRPRGGGSPELRRELVEDDFPLAVEAKDHEYFQCWVERITEWGFYFEFFFFVNDGDILVARQANTDVWVRLLRLFEEHDILLAGADRLKRRGGRI